MITEVLHRLEVTVIKNKKILKCLLMIVVSLLLVLNFSIGVLASSGFDRQKTDDCITISQRLSVKRKRTMVSDAGLTARQRLYLDMMDIRKNFGSKYNKGMLEMIKYAKSLPAYQ